MEPDFGVGMQQFLFSSFTQNTFDQIESKIMEQVSIYLPAISIKQINFESDQKDLNKLSVSIEYMIPTLNVRDLLEFTI